MATIVLSAAGMALGGSVGGSVLGLSMATLGRAAGATLGRVIDARILGDGSEPVETGRVERFRVMGASEGTAVSSVYGRVRIPGQVIWATQFQETATTTGGGKGAGSQPATTSYSYSVSLAVALCEGEITRVGRIWADGVELSPDTLNMRVYDGRADQLPDPKMEAVEGAGQVPAYRGVAYVVFEDLALGQFGNRVPQMTFEVMRPAPADEAVATADIARQVKGVAIIPGTGEYSLATTPVFLSGEFGQQAAANVNSPSGEADFPTSLRGLREEMPECASALLVTSWFGDDLRCGSCSLKPKVEQKDVDGAGMPWRVSGITRSQAEAVATTAGRPNFGGTPSDQSVREAILALQDKGMEPVFYPFILMEQTNGNGLDDPWSDASSQPAFPWRGRMTLADAPGRAGSTDQTAAAAAEVAAFVGTAQVSDFGVANGEITYSGPNEWSYRRFILHYAHLCAQVGGVAAFCIGSEMRGMTQIRGPGNTFPFVDALRDLAADARAVLGPQCKISYAADWSEYHGYQPSGTGDKIFHLDPLWADPNIDFVGIDNYMPLSDWRDDDDHADAAWGSIYNLDYLMANVAGGEGFDWYYASAADRDAQVRSAISDWYGEHWVWRIKDLAGWWGNAHHNRIGGNRATTATAWLPQSKPIWFTEMGCAAVDKGTNEPNKFLDPKSSESSLPHYSTGARDDYLQVQYLRAMYQYYQDTTRNPVSGVYGGAMVDMSRAHVWAWDARPFPYFPGNTALWSDGANYGRGHWLNGRTSARTLASVVAELCLRSGLTRFDVSDLHGLTKGYVVSDIASARSALQPLMVAFGIEASEIDGVLVFTSRGVANAIALSDDDLAVHPDHDTHLVQTRVPASDVAGRLQLGYVDGDGDYEINVAEAINGQVRSTSVARSEFPLVLGQEEAKATVTRWAYEGQAAQDKLSFALPPSRGDIAVGQIVTLSRQDGQARYRIDRIDEAGIRLVEATRVDGAVYEGSAVTSEPPRLKPVSVASPVELLCLDLPLLSGDEQPHAPHIAATAQPWPGAIAVYGASQDANYALQDTISARATVGVTMTDLTQGRVGLWDRQAGVEVRLVSGQLSGASPESLFSGANTIAVGDGSESGWEILQFQHATPVGDRRYRLSGLLRGQAGSASQMPAVLPAGSFAVLMDAAVTQMALPSSARGVPRHLRFGPAARSVSDPSYRYQVRQFEGNGYRPYQVCHLRAQTQSDGIVLQWIRQTRIDGDVWGQTEVPLGEEVESYLVTVVAGGVDVRTVQVATPTWHYDTAMQAEDGVSGQIDLLVAQISSRYGVGPAVSVAQTV